MGERLDRQKEEAGEGDEEEKQTQSTKKWNHKRILNQHRKKMKKKTQVRDRKKKYHLKNNKGIKLKKKDVDKKGKNLSKFKNHYCNFYNLKNLRKNRNWR